jgi:hypothetical protein
MPGERDMTNQFQQAGAWLWILLAGLVLFVIQVLGLG